MRQKISERLRTALKIMKPSQQREFLQQVIEHLSDKDLGLLTAHAVSYLDPANVDRMLNLDTGELLTEERLKAIAAQAGLKALSYRHRGVAYYQIAGWYKDPKDEPGAMRRVTRHVCREDKLPLVSEETVQQKIEAVLADLKTRREAVGSPTRKRSKKA